MKICPKCNTEHEKPGIYCSRKCANSRNWSQEDKDKKSLANKGNPSWRKGLTFISTPERNNKITKTQLQKAFIKFEAGLLTERSCIRKHLITIHGDKCSICGIVDWMGKPITFRVDHINGNAGNNMPNNLRLVCPNCDSQSETCSGKNKGNGRKSRGLPLR